MRSSRLINNAIRRCVALLLAFALVFGLAPVGMFKVEKSYAAQADHVVISQIYGGGGNSGSVWKSDFIELYNPTDYDVVLNGWSVQYASAGGTTYSKTDLSGTIKAHGYYLIKEATGTSGTTDLPTPDITGTIAMGATGCKIALVTNTTIITDKNSTGVIDFVGCGSSPSDYETSKASAPSNTASIIRKAYDGTTDSGKGSGQDTNDNGNDFVVSTIIIPHNSSSPIEPPLSATDTIPPAITHTPVSTITANTPISITAIITDGSSVTAAVYYGNLNNRASCTISESMTKLSGNNYSAVIAGKPAGDLYYYIKAVDEHGNESTDPLSPGLYTITITDTDTVPPSISHTAVNTAFENVAVNIAASITDLNTVTAEVYYGTSANGSLFTSHVPMSVVSGNDYTALIPGQPAGDLYYYVKAVDSYGNVSTNPTDISNANRITVWDTISIEDARKKSINDIVTVSGVVTFIDGSNYYIQDATAGIDIYKSGLSLSVGDRIIAKGPLADYNGLLEIKPATTSDVIILDKGNALPAPKLITISQIDNSVESQIVRIENVTIGIINTGSNTEISDGTNKINIYKIPSVPGILAGDRINVTAVVSQYNVFQLRVGSASNVEKVNLGPDVSAPVITHSQITAGNTNTNLPLEAQVTDDRQVSGVTLYYRTKGQATYKTLPMIKLSGSYSVEIPNTDLDITGLEYYIEATDGTNTVTSPADKNMPYEVAISNNDIIGPVVTKLIPVSGSSIGNNFRPVISADYNDISGVDASKVRLYVDNVDVTANATITNTKISYIPVTDLSKGTHVVKVEVYDSKGNKTEESWSFTAGEDVLNFYFGQLHSHTNYSDGQGTPDEAYTWARDNGKADFFAVTDHSNSFDNDIQCTMTDGSPSTEWTSLKQIADKYNENGRYVAIAGYEMTWSGSTGGWGHINTFNTEGFLSRNSKINSSSVDLKMYYEELKKLPDSISQLNHPGKTFGDFSDFGYYSPEIDSVVHLIEVGNGEGAVRSPGYFPSYESYTRALDKGWHVAPSNNQDNHMKGWVTANEARTVVLANELTRDKIYEAIRKLRVYSTEDRNLKINYKVNGNVMGSILPNPSTLDFIVNVDDPDAAEKIAKVEIITDGGKVASYKTFNTNKADWNLQLSPQYKYYYVKVTEADGDIAVTAPVWVGSVDGVGISNVTVGQNPMAVNSTNLINATVYNNSASTLSNIKVEFYTKEVRPENKIGEQIISSVGSGGTKTASMNWTPTLAGVYKIYATTTINVNGIDKVFTQSISLEVRNKDDLVKVVIDAGHQNQYVSGDYKGRISGLKDILSKRDVLVVENTDALTEDDLKDAKILIITDPQSTDDATWNLKKSLFTDAEVNVIKSFLNNGGSLIITSKADYKDATEAGYESADQGNKILEAIGSNLRFNDDEVWDDFKFEGSYNFKLSLDNYTSSKYNLTPITNGSKYSIFSGCSVVLKPGAITDKVDYLVKAHSTTISKDADNQNDNTPVNQGEVYVLAAEELVSGGKVIVGGSTFFSDFEITSDNVNSNKTITEKILDWMTPQKAIEYKSIKEVRADNDGDGKPDLLGQKFIIEGTVTAESTGVGRNNSFFDVIYVQDSTGGITVFGVSNKVIPLGSKVNVTGIVDQYGGDTELQVSDEQANVIITDSNIALAAPKMMSTFDSMKEENEGWLVKVQGKVIRMTSNSLYLDDGSGEVRVYVNGYIGDGTNNPGMLGKWDQSIQVGDTVCAIGLASEDAEGHRIRVRNTAEIVKVVIDTDNSGDSGSEGDMVGNGNTQDQNTGTAETAMVTKVTPVVNPDGSVKIEVKAELNSSTGTAVANIDETTASSAINLAKPDVDGVKKMVIEIPKVEGATSYSSQLPATIIASGDAALKLQIDTEIATLLTQGNMLGHNDLSGAKNVELKIGTTDSSSLSEDLKAQIGSKPGVELTVSIDGRSIGWNNPDAPAVMSIPYNPAPGELANTDFIVVLQIDNAGNATPVPTSKFDAARSEVVFTTTQSGKYAVAYVHRTFTDLDNYLWAKQHIEIMASRGIIEGRSQTIFDPGADITRADFVKLMVRTFGFTANIDSNFVDVNPSEYYYEAIGISKKLGLIEGIGENKFNPAAKITRQEMMVIIARILRHNKKLATVGTEDDLRKFADKSMIAAYAVNDVADMVKGGIVEGDGASIKPLANTTRAEAAVLLYRVYKK